MRKLPASMVYLDNDTRWSSMYVMIQSAVKNRGRLTWYMQQTPELQDDALTEEDWEDLEDMLKLLKLFKKVTMLGQQKGTTCGSIASTLW